MADPRFPRTIKGVFYPTRQTYLNALAQRHGHRSYAGLRSAPAKKATRASSLVQQASQRRALSALNLARARGLPLSQAAKRTGADLATVKRYGARALDRSGRRLVVRPFDRLTRVMRVLTSEGQSSLPVKDSRTAARLGAYWDAVDHYLRTGDASRLRPFRGKSFFVGKRGYRFFTEPEVLDELGRAGELHFEDLYDYSTAI